MLVLRSAETGGRTAGAADSSRKQCFGRQPAGLLGATHPRSLRHATRTADGEGRIHGRPRSCPPQGLAHRPDSLRKAQTGLFCLRHSRRLVAAGGCREPALFRRDDQSVEKRPSLCADRLPRRHHRQSRKAFAVHPAIRRDAHGHALERREGRSRSGLETLPATLGAPSLYENPNPTATKWRTM